MPVTFGAVAGIARAVGADEFIAGLPNGYDTPILERGRSLSSGQRLTYDALVVAPGIQLDWHKVKGLREALGKAQGPVDTGPCVR